MRISDWSSDVCSSDLRCSELTSTAIERGVAEGDTPVEKLALTSFHFASMILGNQKMIALYFREERYFPEALRARLLEAERAVTSKLSKVIDSGIRRGDFRSCDSQDRTSVVMGKRVYVGVDYGGRVILKKKNN